MNEYIKPSGNRRVKTKPARFHTIEAHNWHIRRYGRCMYCDMGSTAVPKCILVKELNKR